MESQCDSAPDVCPENLSEEAESQVGTRMRRLAGARSGCTREEALHQSRTLISSAYLVKTRFASNRRVECPELGHLHAK